MKCDSGLVWWVLSASFSDWKSFKGEWRGCEGDSRGLKLTCLKSSYCLEETFCFSLYSNFFTLSQERRFLAAERLVQSNKDLHRALYLCWSVCRAARSHSQTSRCFTFTNFTTFSEEAAAGPRSHRAEHKMLWAQHIYIFHVWGWEDGKHRCGMKFHEEIQEDVIVELSQPWENLYANQKQFKY